MPIRIVFNRIRWPQAAVLIAFLLAVVGALAFTPSHLIERAAEADWKAIGAVALGIVTALGGFAGGPLLRDSEPRARRRWEESGFDDEPPTSPGGPRAIDRAERAPGDSLAPPVLPPRRGGTLEALSGMEAERRRRDRDGFAQPPALLAVAALVAILIALALLSTGCMSSVRVHATIASTAGATVDTWCQEELEARDVAQHAAAAAHPIREDAAAAVAEVRASYEPTIGGCTAAKGIHDGWAKAIALGHAGAPFDPVATAIEFVAPFVEVWEGLARASASGAHPIPAPPSELVQAAGLLEERGR